MVERFWKTLETDFDCDTIFDGEFYRHGWKLQQISEAMTVVREEPIEATYEVKYHIFDRISLKPQSQRILLPFESQYVEAPATQKVYSAQDLDKYHYRYLEEGYEGSIIRLGGAPYIHGLTSALLKRKQRIDFEVQVTGVIEGKGDYKGMLGAFRVEDPVRGVGYKVGSGHFTLELRQRYWDNPPIGQWITIYTEVGVSEKGIPLQAQFECVRNYE